jgi:hypothetical protein
MLREAQAAGLQFDDAKLHALNCCIDEIETQKEPHPPAAVTVPTLNVTPASPALDESANSALGGNSIANGLDNRQLREADGSTEDSQPANSRPLSAFHQNLLTAAVKGSMHDVLQFNNGVSSLSVIAWNIMEYLPFRRMDLQEDGSWKCITWPLPKGEVRDVPEDAVIHGSVLRRMEADPGYRPGNLIVGGGGRGVRRAPPEYGMGKWKVHREEGDPVGEVVIRAEKPVRINSMKTGNKKSKAS